MSNVAIEFKNVTKEYILYKNEKQRFKSLFSQKYRKNKQVAINDMSFTINRGDSIALLGKNGAGKSTLLKLITSVIYPTSGEIIVNGRVSALLELTTGFDPEFTGRENIYFRCQVMGLTNDYISEIEQQIIDFADIGVYIDQPVRTYSTGMKARLGFAINSNVSPEILIIDEALSVGDAIFQKKCRSKIKEIVSKGDVTFIFVTHSIDSAKGFCDKGMVIDSGTIKYTGDIDSAVEVYKKITDEH